MGGYVRPRLTDKQAKLLQRIAARASEAMLSSRDARSLELAAAAIDGAFDAQRQKREERMRRAAEEGRRLRENPDEADVHVPGDPWPGPRGGYVR